MITSLATSLHYSILVSAAKVSERCAPAEIVTRIVLDSQERVNHIPQGGGGVYSPVPHHTHFRCAPFCLCDIQYI